MKLFRIHILKWIVSLMLTLGLAVHLAIPYSSKAQKTAFAQWLDRNVVENGEESEITIRSHIKQLPFKSENFPLFLQEASLLVANHKNDFNIPIGNTQEKDISKWLVKQWTQHESQTTKSDALLPETIKSSLKWLLQHQPVSGLFFATEQEFVPLLKESIKNLIFVTQSEPIPFLSGISINAP